MSAPRTCRPLLHRPIQCLPSLPQRRTFLPNPFQPGFNPLNASQTQTLSATRTLPYSAAPIYSIVADVQSYSSFLPYCQSSSVTKWSSPDPKFSRKWPSEAQIVVGWGQLTESFTSRVFCVPGKIVESIGGSSATTLPAQDIAHHLDGLSDGDKGAKGAANGLMTQLRSRWTIEALEGNRTSVKLALEFAFANPMYAALSAGAAPKVAEMMIRAFEERVQHLLARNPELEKAGLGDMEGSQFKR